MLDIRAAELTRYHSWRPAEWPRLRDRAFWDDMDHRYGFSSTRAAYYDRWSELAGRTVYDQGGRHIGQIRDLVINLADDRVHYAVVSFDPSVAAAGRFYAVPLYAFVPPRDGANRLVLNMQPARIASLESFDAYRWPQINEPAYVTRIDRYFVTAFPQTDVISFERLDTNHDGFLSKAELAPLGMTTDASGRYVLRTTQNASALFHRLDVDHDGFLTRSEAEPVISAASFDRMDTNRDGFLSIGEATPELASFAASDRNVLTFDALDKDRDGFLSKAEAAPLFGGVTVVTIPRGSAPAVVSFDALDLNRDGFISREEARAAWGANASVFDRYDTNRDGFLSRAEADPLLRSGIGVSSGDVVHRTIVVPR
jgi:Ca2+-binding EF-hand superfamily protein